MPKGFTDDELKRYFSNLLNISERKGYFYSKPFFCESSPPLSIPDRIGKLELATGWLLFFGWQHSVSSGEYDRNFQLSFSIFRKEADIFDETEFEIQSRLDYPSLLAVSDSLEFSIRRKKLLNEISK